MDSMGTRQTLLTIKSTLLKTRTSLPIASILLQTGELKLVNIFTLPCLKHAVHLWLSYCCVLLNPTIKLAGIGYIGCNRKFHNKSNRKTLKATQNKQQKGLQNKAKNIQKVLLAVTLTLFLNVSLVNLYLPKADPSKSRSRLNFVPKLIHSKTTPKAYLCS